MRARVLNPLRSWLTIHSRSLVKRWRSLLIVAVVACIGSIAILTNVDTSLTEEDEEYIRLIGAEVPIARDIDYANASYSQQIDGISKVISYFDERTKNIKDEATPVGMTREPKDWYRNPTGVCYDLTRVMGKLLRYYGFEVRHVAVYSTQTTGSALVAFATRRNPSHAVLEVLTQRGWIFIDTHPRTVALTPDGEPVSTSGARSMVAGSSQSAKYHSIFTGPYFLVYGLYSRHGMLYPPFNSLPDVSWGDLAKYGCCVDIQ